MEEKILILGAGPAGLACAMELSKANLKSTIIEKEDSVGGLAKTLTFKEGKQTFRTDIGPHRFFSKNKYLYEFIEDLLGRDWIKVKRQTRQLIAGKFYDYPIKATQAFGNVGVKRAAIMGFSYFKGYIIYKVLGKKIENFEDHTIANFGRALGEFNMLNYTEKVWGIPCNKIHPDWANQRIKGLNLVSAILNTVFKKKGPKTLIDTFYYPKFGTGTIYETISKRILKKGSKIFTNSTPIKINHKENRITTIDVKINGKTQSISPNKIVSSIPITHFVNMLSPTPPKEVINALAKMNWRAQIYLFITLNKEKVTDDNWIYFPEIEIPFGRIAEMKNFSKEMSPKNLTSLFLEFFVNEGDKMWNLSEQELFELSIKELEKLNLAKRNEVRRYYMLKRKNVYPVYDLEYKSNSKIVKDYLDKFENLYSIGRPGRFKYNNQDHSLEMGILAAKSITDNKKYDIENVGEEQEYFEKGKLKA